MSPSNAIGTLPFRDDIHEFHLFLSFVICRLVKQTPTWSLTAAESRSMFYKVMILKSYLEQVGHDDNTNALATVCESLESMFANKFEGMTLQDETCGICESLLPFDPVDPHRSYCAECKISTDRCVFSNHLFTSNIHDDSKGSAVLYRCGVCDAVVHGDWLRSCDAFCSFTSGSSDAICPYCNVLMKREH